MGLSGREKKGADLMGVAREHEIQIQITIELCRRGHIVHRTNSGIYYTKDGRPVKIGVPGQSDLQGHRCTDGRCFYIEVKQPGQRPRQNQVAFLSAMAATGAIAFWCDNVDDAIKGVENP